ncbi:MAG: HAD-IC family P-type ATPase [Oscillospiraceae bacterium]|nr:HAD-IC family P-type ATPase [Oscillospiraceae bacterium]
MNEPPPVGLTHAEVQKRIDAGQINATPDSLVPSMLKIIQKNTLTLFNFINMSLALTLIALGYPRDALFGIVAVVNTLMGIAQEVRAKRTLDKLTILSQSKVCLVRDGQSLELPPGEAVLGDTMLLRQGDQVCADATITASAGMKADESLLTGESDRIPKNPGDKVLSGSFITAGYGYAQITAVGKDNYAAALTSEAKQEKKERSRLLRHLRMLIRVLAVLIIPLGAIFFYTSYVKDRLELDASILGTAAAMVGMIPEGLVLLTGLTLTIGALQLARRKALVQSLSGIETLARADVLCLDKTGTITDGTLSVEQIDCFRGHESQATQAISEILHATDDQNVTAVALRERFGKPPEWTPGYVLPFSSERKWSGAFFPGKGSWILGGSGGGSGGGIPLNGLSGGQDLAERVEEYAGQGYRVLLLAFSPHEIEKENLPGELFVAALILLSDKIRPDAPNTFRFFEREGVVLKVISGDHPRTVAAIASRAGLDGKSVDMSRLDSGTCYNSLAEEYTVFGRASPAQKRDLIRAMRKNGHTVCMTGDGVNDILAMRESDCSLAMAGGSGAARSAGDFVLMTSDFSAMTDIMRQGRRVINNIERVAGLYLVKTIYSFLLTLIFIILPLNYPFKPIQMTLISAFMVGIPTFFLALRPDYAQPGRNFWKNVLIFSLPGALIVVFNTLIIQLAGDWRFFDLPWNDTSTMSVLLIGVVGLSLLFRITKPLTKPFVFLFCTLGIGFISMFIFTREFFSLESLFTRNVFFYLPLAVAVNPMLSAMSRIFGRIMDWGSSRLKKYQGGR